MRPTDTDRFWGRVKKQHSGCWEWQGAIDGQGYGKININGKMLSTHRVSWTYSNGDIPSGLFVLHHCDNKVCVNPEHLFLGTQQDNMRDAFSKGLVDRDFLRTHPFNHIPGGLARSSNATRGKDGRFISNGLLVAE